MPLFDFRCPACEVTFELLVRSSIVPACPHCGSQTLDRQVARIAPAATTPGLLRNARKVAMKEGHFSNYKPSERPKV